VSPWRGNARWGPGENRAGCLGQRRFFVKWAEASLPHPLGAPERRCSCGFYGLLDLPGGSDPTAQPVLDPSMSGGPVRLVFGVVEAYGRVLIGQRGWRAECARVSALFAASGSALERLVDAAASWYEVPVYRDLSLLAQEWGPDDRIRELALPAA
jgi:hypothetical protein